ncbi:MAG TPA: hypothetical protein PKC55_08185 [Dysgonomonas sp.]|uniref:hypothetical protein n=1 Tax=unclassified Dysgonomonas TaxID=2630389 RepID=UPI0025BC583C|nr:MULTISPECIES: hypothetical protein [unclassified Dysgonomonas]HML64789.1 hypothetical protein [Dysgonomonas sp.]
MEKRFFAIIAILYLVFSIGFLNYRVICRNDLVKSGLVVNERKNVSCNRCNERGCKNTGKEQCCEHSIQLLKINIDQVDFKPILENESLHLVFSYIFLHFDNSFFFVKSLVFSFYSENAPPDSRQTPLNILHCTYLI